MKRIWNLITAIVYLFIAIGLFIFKQQLTDGALMLLIFIIIFFIMGFVLNIGIFIGKTTQKSNDNEKDKQKL